MKFGRNRKVPKSACPVCTKLLDGASGVNNNDRPRKGNLTVCIYCGSFLVFGRNLKLRLMTQEEIGGLDFEILKLLTTLRKAIKTIEE